MRRLALLLCLLLSLPAAAQSPLVVMNLAAHPDDEDGATLTYYRHARDAVAYSVIFTRGEGGQNEIGPQLYEALGALRTDETERAARVLGTQVFFLNFYDFGFSKHAAEAFAVWGGRDAVTARLVYLIRKLKPDVLFTNHDTVTVGPARQHGQHQAVGIAAYDAFALAADPAYHPEQLEEEGVDLWQPQRLFLRRWGGDEAPADAIVPIGERDPSTGMTYGERAARALGEHASQGMDLFAGRLRGLQANRFVLLRSAGPPLPAQARDLAAGLAPNRQAAPSLPYRIDSGRLPPLPDGAFTLDDSVAVPGQRLRLRWQPALLPGSRLQWRFSGAVDTTLFLSDGTPAVAMLRVRPDAAPTVPPARYQYERFENHPPVHYALVRAGTDEVLAAGYLPLAVAPPAALVPPEGPLLLHGGVFAVPFEADVFSPAAAHLDVQAAVARTADRTVIAQAQHRIALSGPGRVAGSVPLTLPAALPEGDYTVTLTARPATAQGPEAASTLAQPARAFTAAVPPNLRVGLVTSYDNTLAAALRTLGTEPVLLDSAALAQGRFEGLHTIVVDIRAYLVRPDLRAHNDRLLAWVRQGGHLVVSYQKTFEWNPDYDDPFVAGRKNPDGFAPYPLRLGRDRITYEDAPVTVLAPEHPLLRHPYPVDASTWAGWVQERGLYFPATYDGRYRELVSMHDPGEAPLRGGLLLAQVGRGTYLYTPLVWYRQLKELHPGTYRFFANLVSLPLFDGRPLTP